MSADAAPPTRLRHDALPYATDGQLLQTAVPFLLAGLDRRDTTLVVTTGRTIGLLRAELGHRAPQVSFLESSGWYLRPGEAIAGYDDAINTAAEAGRDVRVLGEVAFGDTAQQQCAWTSYESVLNHVFAAAPAWIVCPYDTRALPAGVVAEATRTHPNVWTGGVRAGSAAYVAPEAFLPTVAVTVTRPQTPALLESAFAGRLGGVRRAVSEAVLRETPTTERLDEVLLAVVEVAGNAVRHGGGSGHLTLWREAGSYVCEVLDAGTTAIDPLSGYTPPPRDGATGSMGLWITRRVCDAVQIDLGPSGTSVRFSLTH